MPYLCHGNLRMSFKVSFDTNCSAVWIVVWGHVDFRHESSEERRYTEKKESCLNRDCVIGHQNSNEGRRAAMQVFKFHVNL